MNKVTAFAVQVRVRAIAWRNNPEGDTTAASALARHAANSSAETLGQDRCSGAVLGGSTLHASSRCMDYLGSRWAART